MKSHIYIGVTLLNLFFSQISGEIFTGPFDRFSPWQEADLLIESYFSAEGKTSYEGWLLEAGSYTSVFDWKGGVSAALSSSAKRNWQFDNVLLNLQSQFFNDAVGDEMSLALGGSVGFIHQKAFSDPHFLHYGKYEGRLYATFGKEVAPYDYWTSRFFGFASIGFAEKGVTFGEVFAIYEKIFCRQYTLGFFSMIQGNFKPLRRIGIRWRRAFDNGIQGTLLLENGLTVNCRCTYRYYTKGTKSTGIIAFYLNYPWSL